MLLNPPHKSVKSCSAQKQMMNHVQEVFEESQELVRLRMARNLRPQKPYKTDGEIEKITNGAFKNQVGILGNALPSAVCC